VKPGCNVKVKKMSELVKAVVERTHYFKTQIVATVKLK